MEISYSTLEEVMLKAAQGVRPPERLTVSEAAGKFRKLENVGSYVGPWLNETTPYLTEPMDELTSREFTGMIFVGPAQSGKTDMFLNWQLYSVICDPADMMLVQTAQATARDFSIRRVDRLHRQSTEVGDRLIQRRDADNTFDKKYQSGMLLTLSWPTVNELSGRPVPRLWLTDYDRMVEDVDGEGEPYDLARKRATSFRSHGMCAAESSPGRVITDPKWQRKTPHEAPKTTGILALYNRGDRRLYYWKCISCNNAFEPDFHLLKWPKSEDVMESAEQAYMVCPHCQQIYSHDPSGDGLEGPGKHHMNRLGKWLKDHQIWTPEGLVVGKGIRSDIASFWLKGAAAAFSDWKTLVLNFLKAEIEYEETGSERSLKTTVNVDQGHPYTPKAEAELRLPETIKARARELGQMVVPMGVRFLVASIDVQNRRFVVQVHGIGVGGDIWVIDRFDIGKARRRDEDGDALHVDPGAYLEDWKLLVPEVIQKTYPLSDGSGRRMAIKQVVCDSGGKAGVTAKAYSFVRWLKMDPDDGEDFTETDETEDDIRWQPGLAGRFMLVKGASTEHAPTVHITYPDSSRKDRSAGARGEIPVMMLNSNNLKNWLDKALDRKDPRGGRINFPRWLGSSFYNELCVEIKDPKGRWINPRGYRNEAWDLLAYCLATTLMPDIMLEYIPFDTDDCPGWARTWEENDMIFDPEVQDKPFDAEEDDDDDLEELADILA